MRSYFKSLSALIIFVILALMCSCEKENKRALNKVEAMLQDNPAEALEKLDSLDLSSSGEHLRSRFTLIKAIALDKNHINDGTLVEDMASVAKWYGRYGSRKEKLRFNYYYGDQLRGAGRYEEAAVCFLRSEDEAVRQKDWFLSGLSARSLYYLYAKTHNHQEELSCIKRALDYFKLAGMEVHEDDARIKLAMAYYDNSCLDSSDSLFNESIALAIQKKDTIRLRRALVESVDRMLIFKPYRPDTAIARLTKAERLGSHTNSRTFANYAKAYALIGKKSLADSCFQKAYRMSGNRSERLFVVSQEYDTRLTQGDSAKAFALLRQINDYEKGETFNALNQPILKAQSAYMEQTNDLLEKEKQNTLVLVSLILTIFLLVVVIIFLSFQKKRERLKIAQQQLRIESERLILEEEERNLATDRIRLACEELGSWGFGIIDSISRAYYSSGSNYESAIFSAFKSEIENFRTPASQKRFLENVDNSHDNVITKLTAQIPSLGQKRIMLFAYLTQGLSYTTISVILQEDSKQNLYNKRQRLVETIKDNNPLDKDLFLECLANRPTRT